MILSIKQFVFLVLTLCVITLSSVRAQETGAVIGRNLKKTKNGKAAKNGKNDKKIKAPKKTKAKKNDKKNKKNKKNKKTKAPETTPPLTNQPTAVPTMKPTSKPTMKPTSKPTSKPTMEPTNEPTPSPEPIAFVTLPITVGFTGDGSGVVAPEVTADILLGAFNAFRGAIISDDRRRLDEVGESITQRSEKDCIELKSTVTESGCLASDPTACTVRTNSEAKVITDTPLCAVLTDEQIESKEEEGLETATEIGIGATPIVVVLTTPLVGFSVAAEPVIIPTDMPSTSPSHSPSTSPSQSPSIESAYPSLAR